MLEPAGDMVDAMKIIVMQIIATMITWFRFTILCDDGTHGFPMFLRPLEPVGKHVRSLVDNLILAFFEKTSQSFFHHGLPANTRWCARKQRPWFLFEHVMVGVFRDAVTPTLA